VPDSIADRLEMLIVLAWLDEGSPADGRVALSARTAAADLGLGSGRTGLLALMRALGALEDRGSIFLSWPGGRGRDASVEIDPRLRADARVLFGRD
jgi:hypothetical protein